MHVPTVLLASLLAGFASAQDSAAIVPELVERFCVDCHQGDDADGDFDVGRLWAAGAAAEGAFVGHLEQAVGRVRGRMMPPADEEQPSAEQRRQLVMALASLATTAPGDRVATVRRLTRHQYERTVRALFGVDWKAGDLLPEDATQAGFVGQGDVQNMSPLLFEKYHDAAGSVADAVLDDEAATRRLFGDGSWTTSLAQLLPRAFRREVERDEVAERVADVKAMQDRGASVGEIRRAVLRSVLTSPLFVYRAEFGRRQDRSQLSAHELAVRLSYMLSASMPDDELRRCADDGTLLDREVLVAQALRLVRQRNGRAFAEDFAVQWLSLRDVLTATADFRRYPDIWKRDLRPSFFQEAVRLFAAVVEEDRSVLDLIGADFTFVNATLAKLYGLPVEKGRKGFWRAKLDDERRGGLLGMGAMLMASSYPLRTSPVKRGKWILDKLLDSPPPPPPPEAGTLPKDDKPSGVFKRTLRQRLEQHRKRRSCAGCHVQMDALGFALENYDVVGRWRDQIHGVDVDSKSTLPDGTELQGPVQLKRALLQRGDDFVRAMAKNLLVHGVGREMTLVDEPAIAAIVAQARGRGDRFSALLEAVVTSPLFTQRDPGAKR